MVHYSATHRFEKRINLVNVDNFLGKEDIGYPACHNLCDKMIEHARGFSGVFVGKHAVDNFI